MRPWVKVAIGMMALFGGAYLGVLSTQKSEGKPAPVPGVLAPELIEVRVPTGGPNVNPND